MNPVITVTCPATLSECRCGLDPHPPDVPHQCVDPDPQCGGSWLDHPTEPNKMLVVRWPGIRGGSTTEIAERDGIVDPPEPLEQDRPFEGYRIPRRRIRLFQVPQ